MLSTARKISLILLAEGLGYYKNDPKAREALDPETPAWKLERLADSYPELVAQNPILPLIALEDPVQYERIMLAIQLFSRFQKKTEIERSNIRAMNVPQWVSAEASEEGLHLGKRYVANAFVRGRREKPLDWLNVSGNYGKFVLDKFSRKFKDRFGNKPGPKYLQQYEREVKKTFLARIKKG